jgi:hypothetical protein
MVTCRDTHGGRLSFVKTRRLSIILWTVVATALVEAVTIAVRFGGGLSAPEFSKTAPLLLQIHHMFWSLPLLLGASLVWRNARLSGALVGIASGLILSDLVHHLIVLPLTAGNMGWHWP